MTDSHYIMGETIRLAFALSRDDRDMRAYRADRAAGVAAWSLLRDEAYATYDAWLAEEIRNKQAQAWDAAIEHVKQELQETHAYYKKQIKIDNINNSHIQPCFDAINATGVMNYSQYNAHITSVSYSSMIEDLTFDETDNTNPYRRDPNE